MSPTVVLEVDADAAFTKTFVGPVAWLVLEHLALTAHDEGGELVTVRDRAVHRPGRVGEQGHGGGSDPAPGRRRARRTPTAAPDGRAVRCGRLLAAPAAGGGENDPGRGHQRALASSRPVIRDRDPRDGPHADSTTNSTSSITPRNLSHERQLPPPDPPRHHRQRTSLHTRQDNTRICILGCVSVPGPCPGFPAPVPVMLSLGKIANPEYVLGSIAQSPEEYYLGHGEATGVWMGSGRGRFGLEGEVDADTLRAVIAGDDPATGNGWRRTTAGSRAGICASGHRSPCPCCSDSATRSSAG